MKNSLNTSPTGVQSLIICDKRYKSEFKGSLSHRSILASLVC